MEEVSKIVVVGFLILDISPQLAFYNHYVKEKKLDRKYAYIQNGEKIKFCYLKDPNPIRENVISFIQDFPKELNLTKYIDYETQFNKAFVEPVKAVLNAIGWEVERRISLESFFT